MSVVDLYLPDDLPVAADAELGQALARAVDTATGGEPARCTVFVHRLPVYAVMSAEQEGQRTVRVELSCVAGPGVGAALGLEGVVRSYLRSARAEPTRVLVCVVAVVDYDAVSWPPTPLHGLAG